LRIHSITALVDSRKRGSRGRRATSIKLRREDLAFVKAISLMEVSPALLKELRRAIATGRGWKRPAVAMGNWGTDGPISSHRTPNQLAFKRKAN
jgi:hypothetical protein